MIAVFLILGLIASPIFFIYVVRLLIPYNRNKMIDISKSIVLTMPKPIGFPIEEIKSRKDFTGVWYIIVENMQYYDSVRNVIAFNQWALYCVKYYTKAVLTYGNSLEIRTLNNFITILSMNNLV